MPSRSGSTDRAGGGGAVHRDLPRAGLVVGEAEIQFGDGLVGRAGLNPPLFVAVLGDELEQRVSKSSLEVWSVEAACITACQNILNLLFAVRGIREAGDASLSDWS